MNACAALVSLQCATTCATRDDGTAVSVLYIWCEVVGDSSRVECSGVKDVVESVKYPQQDTYIYIYIHTQHILELPASTMRTMCARFQMQCAYISFKECKCVRSRRPACACDRCRVWLVNMHAQVHCWLQRIRLCLGNWRHNHKYNWIAFVYCPEQSGSYSRTLSIIRAGFVWARTFSNQHSCIATAPTHSSAENPPRLCASLCCCCCCCHSMRVSCYASAHVHTHNRHHHVARAVVWILSRGPLAAVRCVLRTERKYALACVRCIHHCRRRRLVTVVLATGTLATILLL